MLRHCGMMKVGSKSDDSELPAAAYYLVNMSEYQQCNQESPPSKVRQLPPIQASTTGISNTVFC